MKLTNLAVCSCSSAVPFQPDRPLIDVFACNALNGSVAWLHFDGQRWRATGPVPFAPGTLPGPVAAATRNADRLDVFGLDAGGLLQHAFVRNATGPWYRESLGDLGMSPNVTALWWSVNGAPRLDVFGVSRDRKTLVQAYQVPGSGWQTFDLPYLGYGSGTVAFDTLLACASSGDGRLALYAPHQGVGVQRVFWESGWNGQQIAAGAGYVANSQLVACSRSAGLIDLFGWDDTGQLLNVYFDGTDWKSRTLALPGVAGAWALAGGCARAADTVDLFFLTADPVTALVHVTLANFGDTPTVTVETVDTGVTTRVPMPGNFFVTTAGPNDVGKIAIDDSHMELGTITGWTDPITVLECWFHVDVNTTLSVGVAARVDDADAPSTLSFGLTSHPHNPVTIASEAFDEYPAINASNVPPGYQHVYISGDSRTGATFADISELLVTTDPGVTVSCVDFSTLPPNTWKNPNPQAPDTLYYQFGRRGPSAHLFLPSPVADDIEYFYAEITVPPDHDAAGTYYTAPEFARGYLGMQRTLPPYKFGTERVVLFSVWDNTAVQPALPSRVTALGPGARMATFLDEGSGQQTFVGVAWEAGKTYRFVLRSRPDGSDTLYTAWYSAGGAWSPIATIRYPQEQKHLGGLGHFLENFDPPTGWVNRAASYGNQWVRTVSGNWVQVTTATLGGDLFAENRQRLDITAALDPADPTRLRLSNCGFIEPGLALGATITRTASTTGIPVNVDTDLPEPTPLATSPPEPAPDATPA